MKTLYIVSKGLNRDSNEEILQKEINSLRPRWLILESSLNAVVLDERYLTAAPFIRKICYRYLPFEVSQIIETLLTRKRYNVIFAHNEKTGLPLAFIFWLFGVSKPLVLWICRITSLNPKKSARKMWLLKKSSTKIGCVMSSSKCQLDIMVKYLGLPENKAEYVNLAVDQNFWKPDPGVKTDKICSTGMEMRDYPTLIRALKGLGIPCHIAAGTQREQPHETVKKLFNCTEIDRNITVGRKNPVEIRQLYAESRFVVIPLLETDSDNGVTCILEAMAMGRTVICSKVRGHIDIIEDGVTGIYVEQGNATAMREAILDLWNNPEKAAQLGKNARKFIEENRLLEDWVHRINQVICRTAERARQTA